jgi:hypothetical protein
MALLTNSKPATKNTVQGMIVRLRMFVVVVFMPSLDTGNCPLLQPAVVAVVVVTV